MTNYMLTYHGGDIPKTAEEGAKHMAEWQTWADSLGESLINKGAPLGQSKTVNARGVTDGEGESPLVGFSILAADSLANATKMAEACPHISIGGSMLVSEMMEM